jgi:hypothetical protein
MADKEQVMDINTKGYKSTEFWLSLAAVLVGAIMASGVVPDESGWAKVIGLIASVLAALGYTAGRSLFKANKAKAIAMMEAASEAADTDPQ